MDEQNQVDYSTIFFCIFFDEVWNNLDQNYFSFALEFHIVTEMIIGMICTNKKFICVKKLVKQCKNQIMHSTHLHD